MKQQLITNGVKIAVFALKWVLKSDGSSCRGLSLVADPEQFNHCAVCEWVCPDFAVTVRKQTLN